MTPERDVEPPALPTGVRPDPAVGEVVELERPDSRLGPALRLGLAKPYIRAWSTRSRRAVGVLVGAAGLGHEADLPADLAGVAHRSTPAIVALPPSGGSAWPASAWWWTCPRRWARGSRRSRRAPPRSRPRAPPRRCWRCDHARPGRTHRGRWPRSSSLLVRRRRRATSVSSMDGDPRAGASGQASVAVPVGQWSMGRPARAARCRAAATGARRRRTTHRPGGPAPGGPVRRARR